MGWGREEMRNDSDRNRYIYAAVWYGMVCGARLRRAPTSETKVRR